MHADDDPTNKKKHKTDTSQDETAKVDLESPKKESEEPKPRIVLTFRSDKSGAKSSNMKIVTPEEKHEENPRRSARRTSAKCDSDEESPTKDMDPENDDTFDGSRTKHSSGRRKDTDVIASAIARKEKYNEPTNTSTRPSRKIKPTAKVLANEELRMGIESQNSSRLGDTSTEGGVRTRRSAQKTTEVTKKEETTVKDSEMKLKHLCGLGLRSVGQFTDEDPVNVEDTEMREGDTEVDVDNDDCEDDDTEVIVKLLQADETGSGSSGDCYVPPPPRRSRRLHSHTHYSSNESIPSPPMAQDDESLAPRRSTRLRRTIKRRHGPKRQRIDSPAAEEDDENNVSRADEGSLAASPTNSSTVYAACLCEEVMNVCPVVEELEEPVFCQAIEIVDGLNVGCSHKAQVGEDGSLLPMRRASLRAPFLILCKLHTMEMEKHMCCPTCGVFCTQGVFYQCSAGHLCHLDCAVPYGEEPTGCPHCGVHCPPLTPVNTDIRKVQLTMHSSNRRVYLPEQREQCTPAQMGFAPIHASKLSRSPIFPEDLLAQLPDMEKLCESIDFDTMENCTAHTLYEAIIAGESVEMLITKTVKDELNTPISFIEGGTCAHAAIVSGQLGALCLLQYAGANLDAFDNMSRTPLMKAVLALLEKEPPEEIDTTSRDEEIKKEEGDLDKTEESKETEEVCEGEKGEKREVKKEDQMRVIRYLLLAGCDPNLKGPEGMTALHMAAQNGGDDVCSLLIESGAHVDAKDQGGWTALVRAAENRHPDVVRLLLQYGADAASADCEGNGVLHWCALSGDARSLHLLLDAAPHIINTCNAHADTALHIAAREGHYPCVVILLARGARTDIENSSNELPVHVSSGPSHNAIVLNMKIAVATGGPFTKYRLLASDISNGREPYPVGCVNEMDDESVPSDFTYVSRHIASELINIDNTVQMTQSCTCTDGTCSSSCSCSVLSVKSWYSGGRLLPSFPHHDPPMVFECDHTCACNVNRCTNRVVGRVQCRGSLAAPVQVFRTARCGWGLRARHHVRRGELVALYCGELLTCTTADAREMDQYMFALEVKHDLLEQCNDKTLLCVDAAKFGSAARFINHSCHPNLAPVRVFTECRDLRLPTVALFALTDIAALEELTFDYGDKFWSVKSKRMKCECGTSECRYPTISSSDELES
ncbi:unnamed protein product [Leptosia nina]|uniref:Histone-lysine N-methyltransferase EHMT2 n=1 Tax=Leptosia nina TaxID=320188 RepID=A0AAV1JGJ8_9NEOP